MKSATLRIDDCPFLCAGAHPTVVKGNSVPHTGDLITWL